MGMLDDPNDADVGGGLLANDPKQLLALSALMGGAGVLASNRPGMTSGNALGAGVGQGLQTYMAGNNAAAQQQLRRMQAQKYGLESQKLGYEVGNLKSQQAMFGQMFPELGGQQPAPGLPAPQQAGGQIPAPQQVSQAVGQLPQGATDDPLKALGLTREQVKASYAFGGPEAAKNLIQTAAMKRIETGAWEDIGGGVQQNKMTGEKKPISPSLVNVAVNGPQQESEFRKKYGEKMGEQAAGIHTSAEAARQNIARLGQLNSLMDQVDTGKLAPFKANVGAWAQGLGISDETLSNMGIKKTDPINAQAITAITNALTVGQIGNGGFPANNFSDADRTFLQQTMPQLSNTPGGNRIISQAMQRAAERQISKEEMWLEADKSGKDYPQFLRDWNAHVKKTPLFPAVNSEKEMGMLKSGTVFTAPDGSIRVKP